MDKDTAQHWADYFANDVFENNFESRRGVWHIDDLDCLLLYNNNPYSGDSLARPIEMLRIERRLATVGIETLARGESDCLLEDGSQPYSVSLLLDCSRDRLDEVIAIGFEETLKTFRT